MGISTFSTIWKCSFNRLATFGKFLFITISLKVKTYSNTKGYENFITRLQDARIHYSRFSDQVYSKKLLWSSFSQDETKSDNFHIEVEVFLNLYSMFGVQVMRQDNTMWQFEYGALNSPQIPIFPQSSKYSTGKLVIKY